LDGQCIYLVLGRLSVRFRRLADSKYYNLLTYKKQDTSNRPAFLFELRK
jgi:hypothetical protein